MIETANHPLLELLQIVTNHTHSYWGLCTPLCTKLTAHTLCNYDILLMGKPKFLPIKNLAHDHVMIPLHNAVQRQGIT